MSASYSLLAQSVTRNAFGSLVLSGAVVGAPGADNLKIHHEFLPEILGSVDSLIVIRQAGMCLA